MPQLVRSLRAHVLLAAAAALISTATPAGAQSVTIWSGSALPQSISTDKSPVEVGVRFRSDVAGTITGLRFYKGSTNTGTHVGNLWTNGGTKLATATFTAETSAGWQQVTLSSAVAIAANTTYVVSYHTNVGRYAATASYFATTAQDAAPLHALKNGVDGGNGVYHYGSGSAFPDQTFQSTNYWVDVVFTPGTPADTTPPRVNTITPASGATGVNPSTVVTATFTEMPAPSSVNPTTFELRGPSGLLVAATAYAGGETPTSTLIPNAALASGTTYTATVKGGSSGVKDLAGNPMASDYSWSFTTAGVPTPPATCPCSIWNPSTTTPTYDDGDPNAVELGVRFRADTAGYVTGLRFYKFAANTGLHIGNLWTNTGTLVARAFFVSETATGWQQVTFSSPVAIAANTTYVASYHTDAGHYAATVGFFDEGVDNAPLHALRDGDDGPNGIYRYGSTGFPNQTFAAANYWVDPVFSTTSGPVVTGPVVNSITPASGVTGVSLSTVVTATFKEMPAPQSVNPTTFELRDPSGVLVPATAYAGGETPTATLIPMSLLFPATTYQATVKGGPSGVKDAAGNGMVSDFSWSFTTAGGTAPPAPPGPCPCTIWGPSATPASADPDSSAVEVGVRFKSDISGYITGLRFYKALGNTGVHRGTLWTDSGVLMAMATFANESASGWQQVYFPAPVAIVANTTYVASYHTDSGHYAADSRYFGVGVDRAPLHALRDGLDGPNGVYRYAAATVFPNQTFQATNYWVDVVFTTVGSDTTPPTVTSTLPAPGASGVATTWVIGPSFSEPVAPASITSATFELRDPSGVLVPAIARVGSETGSVSLTPTAPLAFATTYTATLKGGANGVKDVAGNPMAADYSWSFTTVGPPPPPGTGPCSLWNDATTPAGFANDSGAVELGVKFQASVDGFITALRFYKYRLNTGPHIGELWTITGTRLATATFTNETSVGWQQVTLSPAVPITAGTTYVAAYHTSVGYYAVNDPYFATAVTKTPLRALADSEGGNGVYRYGPSGTFPNQTFEASNYWVDAVFVTSLPDKTAPVLTGWGPGGGGASLTTNASVTFNEHMDPATITTSSFELRDPSGAVVPATVTFHDLTYTATLDPLAALAYSTTYSVVLRGGTSGPRVMDLAGNAMASNVSWVFTTRAAPTPTEGPGGPILVVTSASSPYSRYYAEILRAEGLNAFDVADISTVTAGTVGRYDVVVLGEMAITTAQATVFGNWVNQGGNLIAMRPDATLSSLLGLGSKSPSSLAGGYLLVESSVAPGAGLAAETLRFHGTADEYALGSATMVAALYSDAVTATSYPAVTLNRVGPNGGEAAAFTYDLARSIVYSRQGNAALPVQNRDGVAPITPADVLLGTSDAGKLAIPQADEQQRLLANLVLRMNRDRRPLPRFWYFPRGTRAVVVMTGEKQLSDAGEAARLDGYRNASTPGCSVTNWECVRATAYLSADTTAITNAAAAAYQADGFELALRVDTGCADWTPLALPATYSGQLTAFAATFSSLKPQKTHRVRCSVWSDYATQPAVEFGRGIRLDLNYSGLSFFTGSGMPMRFTDATGGLIDVYQAATQLDATLGETDPAAIDALLATALGQEGYYGAFTASMQADWTYSAGSDQIIASAKTRGVPVIAARQLLDWIDGRNGSSFLALTWNGSALTFSIAIGTNADGLQAMLPATIAAGSLGTLTLNGSPVAFTKQTIKGIEYVLFQAAAGTYQATYTP